MRTKQKINALTADRLARNIITIYEKQGLISNPRGAALDYLHDHGYEVFTDYGPDLELAEPVIFELCRRIKIKYKHLLKTYPKHCVSPLLGGRTR